jgi:hypothetical protein
MSLVLDGTGGVTTNSGTLLSTSDATINGVTVGKGGGSVSTNTAVGASALISNTVGADSTAVGYQALYTSNRGDIYARNTAIGSQSSYAMTTGSENTSVGRASLKSTNTGGANVAIGEETLFSNTTASNNTAVGYQAAYSNTTAGKNTAVGYQALYSHVNSDANPQNTAVGSQAGYNATGYSNTFIGGSTGLSATTGINQTYVGYGAGSDITTGTRHTILGCFGGNAGGLNITTASGYIVLSDGFGNPRVWCNGNGDFIVGTARTSARGFLDIPTIGGTGSVCLAMSRGGDAGAMVNFYATNSTTTPIGNIYNTGGTNTQYNTSSDYRLKENITPMTGGLDKLSALKPVNWNWKSTGADGQGFIAHELAEVCPHAVSGEKDEVDADGNPVYQGVDTSYLVATLTAALQELKTIVDAQAAEIAELKAKVM